MTLAFPIARPLARSLASSSIYLGSNQAPSGETGTQVFLLVGQSNMVGRPSDNGSGSYPAGTQQYGQSDNTLKAASDPLDHWDEQAGDMGLARQFCIDYAAANPAADIVLIPRADGGTGFVGNHWNPGDSQYNDAVNDTNTLLTANPTWNLRAILWHQGESDNTAPAAYETAFYDMIQQMRIDITAANESTPFIVGNIKSTSGQYNATVNAVIEDVPDYFPATALVNTEDQTLFDGLHYDGDSLDIIGSRYHSALATAATNTKIEAETGATRHWLLGADNQNYLDLVGDNTLTENGTAPTYNGGSLTIASNGDGLVTDVAETETMTMCFVIKTDAVTLQDAIIGGTLTTSGAGSDGSALYLESSSNALRFNERNGLGNTALETAPPLDSWLFIAASLDSSGVTLFRGDATSNVVVTNTGTRNESTRNIGIGDVHYNASPFVDSLPIAEVILFSGIAKNQTELNDIYLRTKTRLASRNITVV